MCVPALALALAGRRILRTHAFKQPLLCILAGLPPTAPSAICASSRRPTARAAAAFTSAEGSRPALTMDSAIR